MIIFTKIIMTFICITVSIIITGIFVAVNKEKKGFLPLFFLLLFLIGIITCTVLFDFTYQSHCKKCGEPRLPQSNYCSVCGEPYKVRDKENECPHCLTENPEGSSYCKSCGEPFEVPEE